MPFTCLPPPQGRAAAETPTSRRALLCLGATSLLGGAAGLAMSPLAASVPEARAEAERRLAGIALTLAEAVEAEFARAEAALLTAAAALAAESEAEVPARPPAFAALDRVVRGAAAALALPVSGLDPLLAQLVDSERPPGVPLPASPAGELAADALAAGRPMAGLVAPPVGGLGIAVPVRAGQDGGARAVLLARLPGEGLAARLATLLAGREEIASARLVVAAEEGVPAETLAWIRAGAAPAPLELPDGAAAVLEAAEPPGEAGMPSAPPLLLAMRRLERLPRCAVVVAALPPPAPEVAAAPAAGRRLADGALMAAIALGGAGLGMLTGSRLRRRGVAAAVDDGTERILTAEREARQALAELRSICDTIPVGLALLDARGRLLSANLRMAGFAGLPPEALPGRPAGDVLPPPLAEAIEAGRMQVLREGRPVLDAKLTVEAPGVLRHSRNLLVSCHPVRDSRGRVEAVSASVQDVTERARAEAGRDLLVRELNHRVKNCLATVQTLAQQTLRHAGDDPAGFARSFGERLRTLARAHDLLTAQAWGETDLRLVVQAALAPWLGDARLVTEPGPEVLLRPTQAQALVLALHELATNAAKYGALTREEGRVRLGWGLDREGMAVLRWVESGGPPVPSKPSRRGFGTRLIEQALRQDLGSGAKPELVFDPLGLHAMIRFRPGGLLIPRAAA